MWDLLKRDASENCLGEPGRGTIAQSWTIVEIAVHLNEPIRCVTKAVEKLLVEDEIYRAGDGGYGFTTLRCTAGGTDQTSSAWNSVSQERFEHDKMRRCRRTLGR